MQYSGTLDLYSPGEISDLNITIKSKVINLTVKDNSGVVVPGALVYYSAVNSPTACGAADTLNCLTQYEADANGELRVPIYTDECLQCSDGWHKNSSWLNTSGPLQIANSIEVQTPQGTIFASDPQNPAWFGIYNVPTEVTNSVEINLPDPVIVSGEVSNISSSPNVIRFLNANTGYLNMTTRFSTDKSYSFKASPNQKSVMVATALRSGAEELEWSQSAITEQIRLNTNFEIPFTSNAQEVEIGSSDKSVDVLTIPEHHSVTIAVTNSDTLSEGVPLPSPNSRIYLGINEDQSNRANYLNGPSCSNTYFRFISLCNAYPITLQVDSDGTSVFELPLGKQLTATHEIDTAHYINADVSDMLKFNGATSNSLATFSTDNNLVNLELPKSTLLKGNVSLPQAPIENATITFNPYSRMENRSASFSLNGLSPAIYGRTLTDDVGNYKIKVNDRSQTRHLADESLVINNEVPGIIKVLGFDSQIANEYSSKSYGHGMSNANTVAFEPSSPNLPPSLIQKADVTPWGNKVKFNFCQPNCTRYTSPTDSGTVFSSLSPSTFPESFNFTIPNARLLKIKVIDMNTGSGFPNAILYTADSGTVPNLFGGRKGDVYDNFEWSADGKNGNGVKTDENGELTLALTTPTFTATGAGIVAVDPENPSRKAEVLVFGNSPGELYQEVDLLLPKTPTQPEELKIEQVSSSNLEVDFSESEGSLIAPLGGYLVTATPLSELVSGRGFALRRVVMLTSSSKILDADATKTNLTDLVPGKRYRISVSGWNTAGIGQKIETIYPPLPVTPPSSSGGGSRGPTQTINPNLLSNVPKLLFSNPLNVKDSFFKSLNPSQISSISVTQFAKLPVKTIALLSPSQADALTFNQLKALKPSQVVALKPSVIAVLDSTQIAALQPADFRLMKTTQIARISAEAAAGLAKTDLNAFTQTQLRSLTTSAVKNLRSDVLKSLSLKKLGQFSSAQVKALTIEQKNLLNKSQRKALGLK
jgi:hypothetical protein